jgi:hypothetical protein
MVTRRTGKYLPAFLFWILLMAVAAPSFAQTPTLGDIARKEQERRKGMKAPTKVLTNDDLKNGGQPSAPPATDSTKSDAPPAQAESKKPAKEKDAADVNASGEDAWRKRITAARDELHRNEVFAEALQTRINVLTGDFAARDNPIERAQIADERQKALAELDRVKGDIEKSKKQIADIEEEARKAGVPPGWLR